MRILLLASLLVAAGLAGCLGGDDGSPTTDDTDRGLHPHRDPTHPDFQPNVVVAVLDSGVNPYHSEFAEHYEHGDPASYIPNYPGAEVLDLSDWEAPGDGFNHDNKDTAIWGATEPDTLYRVNNSKIVGLISITGSGDPSIGTGAGLLPGGGHGTMTASRAVGNTVSVGGEKIRVVVVVGITLESVQWVAEQEWIDMVSISSGASLGIFAPGAANALSPNMMQAYQALAEAKPFFASSGNGVGNTGTAGFPTWLRGPSGIPDAISVGANENGDMAIWHNWQPYVVADGCANPAAEDESADEVTDTGGGTSSAAPYSAGTGAEILWQARYLLGDTHVGPRYADAPVASWNAWDSLAPGDASVILAAGDPALRGITDGPLADGVFTLQEFKDVLYHTALPDGTDDDSDGANPCTVTARGITDDGGVPMDVRAQFQGYGELNNASAEAATAVLTGETPLPTATEADAWYERFHALRTASYTASTTGR
ncbi:MAG: S8 family serine peptidase [Thermoplasmatota archaeon]